MPLIERLLKAAVIEGNPAGEAGAVGPIGIIPLIIPHEAVDALALKGANADVAKAALTVSLHTKAAGGARPSHGSYFH